MSFFILSIILQVALVLHIVKTGRNTTWIWIVVLLPMAGSIAYLIVEVLPDILGSKTGRAASRSVTRTLNPNRDLKQAASNYSVADTIENSMQLAQELMEKQMYQDARALYEKSLTGMHKTDPYIMHGLARAEFCLENYIAARRVLDELIEQNPDFKNADAHLLYARTLEELGERDAALHEYEVLRGYYPGPEAGYRYGCLCQQLGRQDQADAIFSEIVQRAKTSGSHYNSLHREWIKQAKARLNR